VNNRQQIFQDFAIIGAGEYPCEGSTACFRARHKTTGQPVLLHRFRPAETLLVHHPVIRDAIAPDFQQPFMTCFMKPIVVAGSAYLVEPIPDCIPARDAWRAILLQYPDRAVPVAMGLVFQIRKALPRMNPYVPIWLDRIVLTRQGVYGLLADLLPCDPSPVRMRRPPSSDHHAKNYLGEMLAINQTLSVASGTQILSYVQEDAIQRLSAIYRNGARSDRFDLSDAMPNGNEFPFSKEAY